MKHEIEERIHAAKDLFNNKESFPAERIEALASKILVKLGSGKKLAFIGNGGSAAEAMHLAAEFTGKCVVPHAPLNVMCLNDSQSALTAIANDFGVEHMFSRMVEAHLAQGDVLIALSTSGKSTNILNALNKATELGVECVMWTGEVDLVLEGTDIWQVPSNSTPRIQEIHLAWGHILAEVIELNL